MGSRSAKIRILAAGVAVPILLAPALAFAHDPVFGLGPHTLFRGGMEIHAEAHRERAGPEKEDELALELAYGITSDWAAGIELPYARIEEDGASESGGGDIGLFTKYRFWRNDMPGAQESAALFGELVLPTGDDESQPRLGAGVTDAIVGLAYGYEGLEWYRWAAIRYRFNGDNDAGLDRGDRVLADLVVGWRPELRGYYEPDTVWMLELNGEYTERAELRGRTLTDTGGVEWFLSPGIFWTYRNFAVKAGVQIPVSTNRFGNQEASDYRLKLELEWHL